MSELFERQIYECPNCGSPLNHGLRMFQGRRIHVLFCGYGPCGNSSMNDGAEGETADEAYAKLEKANGQ